MHDVSPRRGYLPEVYSMTGSLIELIDRLNEIEDSDPYAPQTIYAEGGAGATAGARARVCSDEGQDTFVCPLDPTLSEVLMVDLAKQAIEVWSQWRNGQVPTPEEKLAAVMHYSEYDSYLPVAGESGG